jgi:N-carbamoyl-L-amino-acid hydrolase
VGTQATYVSTATALVMGAVLSNVVAAPSETQVSSDRLQQHLAALATYGANPEGGVSRVAYSEADRKGRAYVTELMKAAGLRVRVDTAGNIIGRREGSDPSLPAIMLGSHTDSVPKGGNYDGDVGVLGAIEVAQTLAERGVTLSHPLEVVNFTDEEGPVVGSQAMSGHIDPARLDTISNSGMSVRDGIRAVGGNPDQLAAATRKPGELAAYVELHIEQGALLDDAKINIGVVEGIVGVAHWEVTATGFANHAGTTPMIGRRDALLAAAEFVLAVNRVATTMPGRQVATIGQIRAEPGAPNVIPGRVVMSLEIRDLESTKIQEVFTRLQSEALRIATARQVSIAFSDQTVGVEPAPTDERMRHLIAEAATALGLSYRAMPSGAGHDAQEMSRIAPIGMIFVPSVGGISHSPKEYTSPGDIANGANVLLQTVLAIDGGALGRN